MADVTVRNHDPANVGIVLVDGAPPAVVQPPDDLQAKLDAYVEATRADAQRIKDRPPQSNKNQYMKDTRADAQVIIERQP